MWRTSGSSTPRSSKSDLVDQGPDRRRPRRPVLRGLQLRRQLKRTGIRTGLNQIGKGNANLCFRGLNYNLNLTLVQINSDLVWRDQTRPRVEHRTYWFSLTAPTPSWYSSLINWNSVRRLVPNADTDTTHEEISQETNNPTGPHLPSARGADLCRV
jgi:hypothetical protein